MHVYLDLDGTLTDPRDGIVRSIAYALRRLGQPVPTETELTGCIGPPLRDSFARLLGDREPRRIEAAVAHYRERFEPVGMFENAVYPGIPEALGQLARAGATLHLATSKPRVYAEAILGHFSLREPFANVFGAELDGTRSDKAALIAHALGRTGAHARESSMVGDREHDLLGARANGLRGYGVLWGYGTSDELERAGATALVERVEDLCDVVTASGS